MFYQRVAVIGVGLIGGSFALALKGAKRCGHVVGAGRSAANLELALERGAVDSFESEAAKAVRGADLVLVAAPVAQFEKIFLEINPHLKPDTLVMDAGSTKRDVVAAARKRLGGNIARFVPAHPIAGAEQSGAGAADAGLFRGRRLILTPLEENKKEDVETAAALWAGIGARVSRMSPQEHDEVFAAVSHLPHLLAFALVSGIGARADAARLFGYAAGGFRDFTRIASSDPEMWRDICMANSDQLLKELGCFSGELEKMRKLLESRNSKELEKLFAEARAARGRWLNGGYE
ncbi:MAG TPA: prephenate dehydrogenase/arogenate dehydrogenase family protein [Burkholderiales bacterium]|nr:prephenate dehydrogenase/arogenate dehydrogenase family protein [Burkholderiales bacterium]